MRLNHLVLLLGILAVSSNPDRVCAQTSSDSRQKAAKKTKKAVPLPDGVEVVADIEYDAPGGVSLLLDLYRPEENAGPVPVVIFVHGGGWKNGSKSSGRAQAAWLAQHGIAVASIDYRLTDKGQWPDQINDCYSAVRWVRGHASDYGLDGTHIGCWGTSAGAHLAALMGTRPCPDDESVSSRVQAVCDWFGPSELLTMPPNNLVGGRTLDDISNSNGAKLLGATVRDVPELARDASALDNVSGDDPPFLIMHGDADPGVPLTQSEKLQQRLVEAGVPSNLIVLEGAGHGGPMFKTNESRKHVLDFFTKYLKRHSGTER